MDTAVFAQTTRALLEGAVICETSSPGPYRFLQSESNLEAVRDYLVRIERSVRATDDGKAFFCAYLDISEPGAKKSVKGQFRDFVRDIEPLVKWLRIARECHPAGRPLEAGDLLTGSEMLEYIERSPILSDELTELTKSKVFKSTAQDGKGRMRLILDKLVEQGYLTKLDSTGSRFKATGRWSYLYDVLETIRAMENLDLDQDEELSTQGDLL
ncbi:hypothetical protein [Marinobacterium lutimaris]|uniref:Uncharacterized protein n=1 Tax=Marinobacterium lutimaris TaxID=568106 RepID=A0A1H5VSK7_9GAMM|nr:hypothetical protein [Marinobacterium lutimaris]SEF89996.1 hypothetical protein SAMN05444390_101821 [Marinobacterium lutimaris]